MRKLTSLLSGFEYTHSIMAKSTNIMDSEIANYRVLESKTKITG